MSAATKHNDTKKDLPHGWRWVKLGTFMPKIKGSLNPAQFPNESFTLYSIPSFDRGLPDCLLGKTIGSSKQLVQPGDVLLSKIVPHIRRTWVVDASSETRTIASTEWIVFRTDHANADFLKYALLDDCFHKLFMDTTSGMGGSLTRARPALVKDIEIPLPPLSEQKRIASILKDQMASIDKARAAAEARLEAVKALPAAFLRRVFPRSEDPLPKGWRYGKLKEVARLQGGYAFKSAWFKSTGIRLLRNANIYQDYISWSNVVYLSEQRRGEFEDYELKEGDIVLSLDRPVVAAGLKVSRISKTDIPSLLLQRVVRFNLKKGFSSDFLYSFLHTEAFKAAITKHDQSLGVPHVSPSQVENTVIPIPPLAEQNRLATLLRDQMASAEKARASAEAELQTINALPAALLRKAFNGEL